VVIGLALVAAPLASTAQTPALSPAQAELRHQGTARFAVVPLENGLALSGASQERRVEIDNNAALRRLFAAPTVPPSPAATPRAAAAPATPVAPVAPAAPPPPVAFDRPSLTEAERVYRRTGACATSSSSSGAASN